MHIQNRNFLPVINSMRGIAALMVCLFHFVSTTTGLFDQNTQNVFSFGKFGVHIFFVISGFVIPLSMLKDKYEMNKFPSFFAKRVTRIEPPYLVSLLLVILYTYVRNFIPGVNKVDLTPDFSTVLLHLGYLVPFVKEADWLTPVYWTLAIEFQYYLIISLLMPLITLNITSRSLSFLAMLLLGLFIKDSGFIFIWFPLFVMGIYSALYWVKKIEIKELVIGVSICLLLLSYLHSLVEVLFGLLSVIVILKFHYLSSKIGNFFGSISYSLYLLHSIIGAAFINFMTRFVDSTLDKILIVAAGLTITIISSYIFYRLIEKPSQLLSKRIDFKKKALEDSETKIVIN